MQKGVNDGEPLLIEKHFPAVARAVQDFELRWQSESLIGALEFVGLIDRHLRILIAMQQEEKRIVRVHVKDGTGEARELGLLFGQAAEKQLKSRFADAQAVGRRLREDGCEVRCAEKADDALNGRAFGEMISHRAFEFPDSVGHPGEGGEMPARG